MEKKYLIVVGEKFVSSPADKLTDNREKAGVFHDDNIDVAFAYWDKKSNGNADIIDL
jgi:hypothetical protein